MAFTAGDPGEQSAADAAQSAAVDAATSGGRDFGSDSGPQSGSNVGGKDFGQNLQDRPQGPAFGGMDMSPGRSRSMFGTTYGTQLAGIDQNRFNQMRGITATNPFGSDNIFSRYLGIDPKNIDYTDNISLSNRLSIANNQFSKFVNPQNRKGMPGYNPAYPTAEEGKLRAGVQDEGYMTAYGPVMEQARQQSTGEMFARGLASLTPIGPLVSMMGTKEYGLPGMPGFESFDPNNPRQSGGILGAMLGGLNPTQAKDALVGAFAPVAPAPTPTSIGTAPADLKGFENRFSQHPLTGETTVSTPVDNTLQPGFSRTTTETLPDGRTITVDKETGAVFGTNLFGGPQSSLQNITAGEQIAGLFGENPKAAGFRDLEGMIKSVVDRENLPDNQNMYGPGMPDQTPLTPDELNDILAPSGMELGRGPSTANQYADLSGLLSQGMTAIDDIVSIPGGYMDTKTGKQYSGTYNPSTSGRTYTGTQRSSSSPAPFSGARLRQGIANIFGG